MKKAFILLFCLCLLCGCNTNTSENVKPAGSDLKIMVATDMHFLASDYHDGGEASQAIYNVRDGKITYVPKDKLISQSSSSGSSDDFLTVSEGPVDLPF